MRPADLLLEEPRPLLVRRQLAVAVGLQEAIQLQQLHWLLDHYDSRSVQIEERRWLKAEMRFWCAQFPWTSEASIRRAFDNLKTRGLVERNRGREASVYTINYPAVDALASTAQDERAETAHRPDGSAQPERAPSIGEGGEEGLKKTTLAASGDATGGQLFEAPPATPTKDDGTLDADVDTVWASYVQHFGDRLRVKELTTPRRRTIVKALKAVGWKETPDDARASLRAAAVELCQRAIVGLKSYRADHPDGSQDVNISVIFETGPHSKSNLTDQITWWADQGKSSIPGRDQEIRIPLDLAGVPSVTKGTIQSRRREVGQMFDHPDSSSAQERGKAAVDWLKTHIGHEPKIEDGEFRGWQLVADFSPVILPSPRHGPGGDRAPKQPGTF